MTTKRTMTFTRLNKLSRAVSALVIEYEIETGELAMVVANLLCANDLHFEEFFAAVRANADALRLVCDNETVELPS